jgi:hypothetical protein
MDDIQEQKAKLRKGIEHCIFKCTDDKAILQLKYDRLNLKNNIVQISVIFMSTLITFIEAIKATYDVNEKVGVILPIIISSYIGLIVAIIRFLKYDDKRENISKTIERFSYIINRYKKTKHDIKYFVYSDEKKGEWENLLNVFHNETYDYLISTREMFDNLMSFSEKVYYTDKLKILHIEAMFNDRDENNIANNRKEKHRKYYKETKLLDNCCNTKKMKDYDEILDDFDNLNINAVNKPMNIHSITVI